MTTNSLATCNSSTRLTLTCMSLLRYICLFVCLSVCLSKQRESIISVFVGVCLFMSTVCKFVAPIPVQSRAERCCHFSVMIDTKATIHNTE